MALLTCIQDSPSLNLYLLYMKSYPLSKMSNNKEDFFRTKSNRFPEGLFVWVHGKMQGEGYLVFFRQISVSDSVLNTFIRLSFLFTFTIIWWSQNLVFQLKILCCGSTSKSEQRVAWDDSVCLHIGEFYKTFVSRERVRGKNRTPPDIKCYTESPQKLGKAAKGVKKKQELLKDFSHF